MSQPIRTLARILLVPAALAAMTFAGQSTASASTLRHWVAQPGAVAAASPQVHFNAQPKHHSRWA